jgi:hypothetical protein
VAEDPPKPSLRDRENWSWREWYNGDRHHFEDQTTHFPLTGRIGVSGPYINKETGQPVVSLSFPVRQSESDGPVIGVLLGVVPIERLSVWLNKVGLRQAHGSVVLLNRHRHVVLHTGSGPLTVPDDRDPDAAAGPLFEALAAGRTESQKAHRDPFTGATYVAACAPVPPCEQLGWDTGWGVVVQSDRAEVLAPVNSLRGWLRRAGLIALGAVGVLTSGLWAWLIWRLRQDEAATTV